ncbi:DUF262 domain-containing protein [Planomicrobium okeanokoites]|uniref:DUF262 domain-containing protein n=1 Tax=Planomicrobium okeanokoites TaxID=244 RepID=UPI002491BC63|nr:DUF262 domain-containing protein [Planomicrobium okeanokoites]
MLNENINEEVKETSSLDEVGDISQAFIVSSDWTIETIYSQIKKGNIDLNPSFQRRDVWTDAKKSRLIESILLRVPIPQILLAEKEKERNKYIVLDGKQRLLAIEKFMDGLEDEKQGLKLSGLTVLTNLKGKTAKQIFNEDYDLAEFENETIRSVFIRNWPSISYLYTVFNRLNTGSTSLSPQELRLSLYPGEFTNFIGEVSDNRSIQRVLGLEEPDKRMRDIELVVRYFSFKIFGNQYKGKLKIFFDNTVNGLNQKWNLEEEEIKEEFNELINAINFTYDIFGNKAFSRPESEKPQVIKPIFEFLTFYFSDPSVRDNIKKVSDYSEKIRATYNSMFDDEEFLNSIESHTSDIQPTQYRFEIWAEKLNALFVEEDLEFRVESPIPMDKGEK